MPGPNISLTREATVRSVDLRNNKMTIAINLARSDYGFDGQVSDISLPIPLDWAGPNGEVAGGCPVPGSTIWIDMTTGGRWNPGSYTANTDVSLSSTMKPGRYTIQSKAGNFIFVDPVVGVQVGDNTNYALYDSVRGLSSSTFDSNYSFSEASTSIVGPVLRDQESNKERNISGSALTSHSYQDSLREIGLDPKTRTGLQGRNPGFVESRNLVYEFKNGYGFTDDSKEVKIYDKTETNSVTSTFQRRQSRADAFSLSLIEPNQFVETIIGTGVDFCGNILDLNRVALPSGGEGLSFRGNNDSKSEVFSLLREQARKSIGFHFEMNSRKENIPDLENLNGFVSGDDYGRNRSRFSLDIDKEGQFKLNIPMSSNIGNVGLVTRTENYTTLKAIETNSDPRAFARSSTNQDIFLDSFGSGTVTVEDAPIDRITDQPIKLGTAYHSISDTLQLHARTNPVITFADSKLNKVSPVTKVVEPEIVTKGESANAGGRSGTITIDGMINMSIGANTSDRQSMWLDCAGGIVSNIGRDIQNISYAGRFDGDIMIQVGGATIDNDSRFGDLNNGNRDGVVDVRVVTNAQMHIVRIDSTGVRVYTPGEVDIVSEGMMRFKSRRNKIVLDAEEIWMYGNDRGTGRLVRRIPGLTI